MTKEKLIKEYDEKISKKLSLIKFYQISSLKVIRN